MAVKATKFDHVAITVSDTQKSLDFYVGKLGLRQVEQHALEGDKVDEANGLQGARAQSTRLLAPESTDVLIDLLEYWDHEQQNQGCGPQPRDAPRHHPPEDVLSSAMSGRSLMSPSTPRPTRWSIKSGSFTVHGMTSSPARRAASRLLPVRVW